MTVSSNNTSPQKLRKKNSDDTLKELESSTSLQEFSLVFMKKLISHQTLLSKQTLQIDLLRSVWERHRIQTLSI